MTLKITSDQMTLIVRSLLNSHRLNNNWTNHKSKCFPGLWLHAGNAVKEIVSTN